MITEPRQKLQRFYDQALLTPELLCLNCAHTSWTRPQQRCSPERQEDCMLFATEMLSLLADPRPQARGDQPARLANQA